MDPVPAWSRAVDRATGLAGLLLALAAASRGVPPWTAWSVLPFVLLAGRRPVVLPTAASESLVIGLDSALLVLLGLTLPFAQALLVWGVSVLVGELTMRRALDTRLFNAGVSILSGALALAVLAVVPADLRLSPWGLGATVLAAAAYFGFDYVWSAVSVAVAESALLGQTLRSPGLPLAFSCFLAVDSLGFLAAVVLSARPWAVVLLTLPFVSLLVATNSWSLLRTSEQQNGALATAAIALQHAGSVQEVEDLLVSHATRVARTPSAAVRDDLPGDGAAPGLRFTAGGRTRELVLARRITGKHMTASDLDALRVLAGVAEQAAERLGLLEELRRSALHDPLTGLANRTAFGDALETAVRSSEGTAVLYCDLDGFKGINDLHGHAAGDAVLVAAADRLQHAVRPGDLPVRLGGDEFAVLLRGLAPHDPVGEADRIAQRVRTALADPYQVPGGPVAVPASIGVCVRTADELPEDLLTASDAAMYAAKARGGGVVELHGPAAGPRPVQVAQAPSTRSR